jgi:hypothetical protein
MGAWGCLRHWAAPGDGGRLSLIVWGMRGACYGFAVFDLVYLGGEGGWSRQWHAPCCAAGNSSRMANGDSERSAGAVVVSGQLTEVHFVVS